MTGIIWEPFSEEKGSQTLQKTLFGDTYLNIIADHYAIKTDDDQVQAFASQRIPFETKADWRADFRKALNDALSRLSGQENDELAAVYGSSLANDPVDTENALFYNLGQSSFTKSAGHALSFSTLNATQTARVLNENGFPQFLHYYQYRVTPALPWDRKPAASWKDVPLFSLRGDHSPFDYWLAMRENLSLIHLHNDQEIKGDFGLDIAIESPETTALNLATPIKSLLDGVICAFHRMPALVDRDRLHISASRLRCPLDLLIDSACSLLGEREFVRPTQKHVLWDPQDMLCKEARLTIHYGKPRWQFSGALYPI